MVHQLTARINMDNDEAIRERIKRLLENGEINNKDEREKIEYLIKNKEMESILYTT